MGDSGQSRILDGTKMKLLGSKYETSIFNPDLAQKILSAYCPLNAKIFDPFAGGGTRAIIANVLGFEYFGIELRKEEVDRVINRCNELGLNVVIKEGSAQNKCFEDNTFDFSYTCPPYYNLEVYSNLQGDLSNASTYQDFLAMLYPCMENTYKCLKKNSPWFV